MTDTTLPFGKYRDKPIPGVPSSYLTWLHRETKLSAPLRAAVAAELSRRGIDVPPPPPRPDPKCREHPTAGYRALWGEDRAGRKFIRAECRQCHRSMGHLPLREPYTGMADANATATPVLDALVGLEDAGAGLASDGTSAWITGNWERVPQPVRDAVRQAKHSLGVMIGNTLSNITTRAG
jgi:hypothetical protein